MESVGYYRYEVVATAAAEFGRPAIPGLMLLARNAPRELTRLCAIHALRLMAPREPVANEALRRIARLKRSKQIDRVWLAAVANRAGPSTHEPRDLLEDLYTPKRRAPVNPNAPFPPYVPPDFGVPAANEELVRPTVLVNPTDRPVRVYVEPPRPDTSPAPTWPPMAGDYPYDGWWREQQ